MDEVLKKAGPVTVVALDPGVCQFRSKISVTMDEDRHLAFKIETQCPYAKKMAAEMPLFEMFDVIKMPFCDNPIYQHGGKHLKHAACPIPMAMIKAGEVVTGLGL
ncbi:MAG: hypothetical protein ABR986_02920, partial [Methanomassiliicoccales archaeon]